MQNEFAARLQRLEDIEAIRQLKARYLFSCDQKRLDDIRDCFVPGEVEIDYGRVGVFTHRDQLMEVFSTLACHEHIVEMHHGVNPQIDVLDDHRARATWGLHYFLVNKRDCTITQLGAYYDDEYLKLNGQWKISRTRCVVTSTLVMDLAEGVAKVLFAGSTAPAEIDDPSRQA